MSTITRDTYADGIRRGWYPVATTDSLDRPQAATLLGEQLVAFRTESGQAAVVGRMCSHRGGNLAMGEVVGEAIACPYHGWRYGTDGICTLIPAIGPDGRIPENARVRSYPATEKYGLVWTCVAEPLAAVPDLPELESLGMAFLTAEPFQTRAGLVNALENFRDVAHLPFVHRTTIGDLQPEQIEPFEVTTDGFETMMTRVLPVDDEDAGGGTYGGADGIEVTYHAVAPSLASARLDLGSQGQRIVMECFQPIDLDGGCRIFLVSGTAENYTATMPEEALAMEKKVVAEDVPIIDGLIPSEPPLFGEFTQVSTLADKYTAATRQAVLRFAQAAADESPSSNDRSRTQAKA